jgi:hypothetical protein
MRLAMLAAGALALLTGCQTSTLAPRTTAVAPQTRPASLVAPVTPAAPTVSRASAALATYYTRVQADLLTRGLLRTDGGGPDTQFTDTMLVRNFERIALAEEYQRGAGLTPSSGDSSAVKKWLKPIRVAVEFGTNVPAAQQPGDRAQVAQYAARLSRVTGHPITMSARDANFHVLFVSEDDRSSIAPRIRQIVPDVAPSALRLFDTLPRAIHCLVIAFSEEPGGFEYGQAVAVIRSEHPDLLRQSCVHEEMAQGLGLGNDDPRARPSIFNDDDEFALLTSHDEMLLKILYDPRLKPGMSVEQARPVVMERARALAGSNPI